MSYTTFNEKDFHKNIDLNTWKKLVKFVLSFKKEIIILIFVMIAVAVIDAVFPIMTRKAIDDYIVPNKIEGLKVFGIYYLLLIVFQAVNVWLLIVLAGKIDMGVIYNIRKKGFKKLQELSFSFYDKTPTGWLMARLTSDCSRLGDTIAWGIVDFVWGVTMMLAITFILFYLNWKLALVVLVVVPPLVVISLYFQKKILKSFRKVRKINSKITSAFNEGIMGAKTTKTLRREEENLKEFQFLTGSMREHAIKAAIHSSVYLPIVLILGAVGSGLAVWLGGNGVIAGALTYGTLVAFISYMTTFFEPIRQLARIFAEFQNAQASAERIISLLNTEPEVKDSNALLNSYEKNPQLFHFNKNKEIKGEVEFCDVSFKYTEGEQVLEDFSLKVNAGENIALVGETGAGKTTIVNLVCRFYEPTAGKILIDGENYKELPLDFIQSNIGMVLQNPHLFKGTVKENIRYGNLDADNEQIIKTAKLVNAHPFIKKHRKGYEAQVGEGGSSLSTGQKQLITFARALLADPAILILDEATSSVDTETEIIIQNAIRKLLKGRTSFVIAHRLSTIRHADRILVLENGKIIEEGSHNELIKQKRHYFNL